MFVRGFPGVTDALELDAMRQTRSSRMEKFLKKQLVRPVNVPSPEDQSMHLDED